MDGVRFCLAWCKKQGATIYFDREGVTVQTADGDTQRGLTFESAVRQLADRRYMLSVVERHDRADQEQ